MSYILLEKQNLVPPEVVIIPENDDNADKVWLEYFDSSKEPIAYDFETSNLSAHLGDAVSVAISNGKWTVAMKFVNTEQRVRVCNWLLTKQLIAHNGLFDGNFVSKYTGQVPWHHRDTMVMFKTLANEGFLGQSWSLKTAMTDVLGWPEANNDEIKDYMKANKCLYHEVPWHILGRYNALDAAATYQLYSYLETFCVQFPDLPDYWQTEWSNMIALLTEQNWNGIRVNVSYYTELNEKIKRDQDELLGKFMALVQPHVNEFNEQAVNAILPPKKPTKKDGSDSAAMEKWRLKVEEARATNHFNVDSPAHLAWLFYTAMRFPILARTASGAPVVDKKVLGKLGEPGKILAAYRKKRDERKFITSLLNAQLNGRIHPDIRVHGTISTRSSSGSSK